MAKKKENHKDRAHAKYSASGSSRWINCPASIGLSEEAPPQADSKEAKEGTEAHECLEFLLNNRKKLKAAEKMALKKYNIDQVNHGLDAVAYVMKRAKELGPEIIIEIETKIDASSFTCKGQFGTSDITLIQPFGKLIVIDYKYGAGIAVDVKENSQGIYYALGMAAKYDNNFCDVEIIIIQPRIEHPDGTIRSQTVTLDYLLSEWVPKFKEGIARCEDPFNAYFKSGSHCQFCPAAVICPEISKNALTQAQIAFDDNTLEIETTPEVKDIAIENLPSILEACEKLERFTKEVRAHAYHVLERGEPLYGFKLVEKRGTRKWKDLEKNTKAAHKLFGNIIYSPRVLLSPAQFEKSLALFDKKEEKKALLFVKKSTVKESSGFTMVSDNDNRESINYLETVFDVVEDVETKKGDKELKKEEIEDAVIVETSAETMGFGCEENTAEKTTKKTPKGNATRETRPKTEAEIKATKKTVKKTTKKVVKKATKKTVKKATKKTVKKVAKKIIKKATKKVVKKVAKKKVAKKKAKK